jgi:exopolysaccharide biosynthesis predicted pyruvyltransferase EpsI
LTPIPAVPSEGVASGSTEPYREVFAGYRREIDALLDVHIPRAPVALLQFPYDGNVGNHMMWVATTDYLRSRNIPIVYAAHGNNFKLQDLARVISDGSILFLGGVTISRLWPRHAEVKREVAAAFPKNPLISLPSTSLFVDEADKEQAGTIFGDHSNVTVMSRDPISCDQARRAFPSNVQVLTVPDMALRLDPQPVLQKPQHDIIWLARDDHEGVGASTPDDVFVFDWTHDLKKQIPRAYTLLRTSGVFSRVRSSAVGPWARGPLNRVIADMYRRIAVEILAYGNRTLDLGKVLVTDRLHPHVLTALRDQHAVLLPDKFGKNRAVYDHYTHKFKKVHFASNPAEALALARSLVANGGA